MTITSLPVASSRAANQRAAGALTALLVAALLTVLAACSAPSGDDATAEAGDGAVTYSMRGQVTALPDAADPLSDLRIRHEPVDDFVSIDGEVVGMDSMNMPFPVGSGVDVSALHVGDKVAFTMVVDWDADVPYQVTGVEVLPPDTELTWGQAQASTEAGDEHAGMEHADMEEEGMEHGDVEHGGMGSEDMQGDDGGTPSATTSDEPGGDG